MSLSRAAALSALSLPLLLAACSGDDTNPALDAGPDATTSPDGSLDASGDAPPDARNVALDAAPDALADATIDAPIDAPPDAPSDGNVDANDGSFDAGPPPNGEEITAPLTGSFAGVFSLQRASTGPLLLEWTQNATSVPVLVQFTSVTPDAGTIPVVSVTVHDVSALHFATNGSVLVYTDPSLDVSNVSQDLWSAPLDNSAAPARIATGAPGDWEAIGVDGTYAYAANYGGVGVTLGRVPLGSDAGTIETLAYSPGGGKVEAIQTYGSKIYLVEDRPLGDGGMGYAIASYPSAGLPDGGAPTIVGSGDGVVQRLAVDDTLVCWSRGTYASGVATFAVTCNDPSGSSQVDVVPTTASTLGVAVDQGTLWFGTSGAIERFTPPGTTPTLVAPAIASTGPFLALDATRVYWADMQGSIRATAR